MILEYDDTGFIFNTINDPVPQGYEDVLIAAGRVNFIVELLDIPVNGQTHYIDLSDKSLKPRTPLDIPAEIELFVGDEISLPLPDPCDVIVNDQPFTVTGGELVLEGEMPASYDIHIYAFPFIVPVVRVTVHEN